MTGEPFALLCAQLAERRETGFYAESPGELIWLDRVCAGDWAAIPQDPTWESGGKRLALLIDGWALWEAAGRGDLGACLDFARHRRQQAETSGAWEGDAFELWVILFALQRDARWNEPMEIMVSDKRVIAGGVDPQIRVIDLLCRTLRARLVELASLGGRSA